MSVLVDELHLVYVAGVVHVHDCPDIASAKAVNRSVGSQGNNIVFADHRLLNITCDQPGSHQTFFAYPDRENLASPQRPGHGDAHLEFLSERPRFSNLHVNVRSRAEEYARFGAVPLLDDPLKLVLPLDTIAAALNR